MKNKTLKTVFLAISMTMIYVTAAAQVVMEKQIKISDKGLYFDGDKAGKNDVNNGNGKYDFIFGKRITPHGDCIKEYNGFVFMTWYRGDKLDRHVMLSRYNTNTGVTKTIEFPHRHTGFQNRWWLGESHNTIAIGISPLDGTIHMLYDMHSYDEDRPSDGSFSDDYFRYTFSKKDAATVADSQFNLGQFVKNSKGGYKHLEMKKGVNYRSLTYPNFFLNKKGELFMWIREGGNDNGAYKFCKYDGNSWSNFKQFNILGARNRNGVNFNWGLYGDIKFSGGKMRIGFASRFNNKNDKYKFNNGFHYAFSDDQDGLTQWKDHTGKNIALPVVDPTTIKISEPGNLVPSDGKDSVTMSGGADWITTDNEDIHFVGRIQGSDKKWVNVHTYKKAGAANFTTATDFPGGNLYTFNNEVYLIGLAGGRIFVEKAAGGTNNWTRIYYSPAKTNNNDVILFRHGNVYIDNGKIYFYMMENGSGSAQPIYLQILDLGLDNVADVDGLNIDITAPVNNANVLVGQEITLSANVTESNGNLDKVNFKINGDFYKTVNQRPFTTTFTPETAGTYQVAVKAFDNDGVSIEKFVTITASDTVQGNQAPTVTITSPLEGAVYDLGEVINLEASATDPDGNLEKVNFKINDAFYKTDNQRPFENTFSTNEAGIYKIAAKAFDKDGLSLETSVTISIGATLSNDSFTRDNKFENIKLYPSPTATILNVTGLPAKNTKASIIDATGKILMHKILSKNNNQILVSKLANGIYFLKLQTNLAQKSMIFIKN